MVENVNFDVSDMSDTKLKVCVKKNVTGSSSDSIRHKMVKYKRYFGVRI